MRKFALMLVLLVAGVTLAFAGGGGEGTGQAKNIAWQVWITPNLTRAFYDEVVQAFEKKNPNIKVGIVEANAATLANADDFIKTRLGGRRAGSVVEHRHPGGLRRIRASLADSGQRS